VGKGPDPDVKVASAAVMLSRMPDGEFSEHAVDLDDAAAHAPTPVDIALIIYLDCFLFFPFF